MSETRERKCVACGDPVAKKASEALCPQHMGKLNGVRSYQRKQGRPVSTVDAWLQQLKSGAVTERQPRAGRPPKAKPQTAAPVEEMAPPETEDGKAPGWTLEERALNHILTATDWTAVPLELKRRMAELVL